MPFTETDVTRRDITEGVGTNRYFNGNMKLYALYGTSGVHIDGDNVTMTVSGPDPYTQTTSYQKYWPYDNTRQLTFHSVAPLPNSTNNDLSLTTAGLGITVGTYTIKPEAVNQSDLMFATTGPQYGGNVALDFQHVLSRITFTVIQDGYPAGSVEVQKVTLRNIMNGLGGTLSDAGTYTWTVAGTPSRSDFSLEVTTPGAGQEVTETEDYLRPATGSEAYNMFLFPHTNTQFGTADLYVEYSVDGTPHDKSVPLASIVSDHEWPKGKWINYQISFSPHGITFNTSVKGWGHKETDWDIRNFRLEASQSEVNITDYNGARIYFSSNKPDVRVLDEVYEDVYQGTAVSNTRKTNEIFNDLAKTVANQDNPYRFHYDYNSVTGEGTGYIELLLDDAVNAPGEYSYRLVLAASDTGDPDGRQLRREIRVNVKQYGYRSDTPMIWSERRYVGAFFRMGETGERIVMEQNPTPLGEWVAQVQDGDDWVVISATPSLDPGLGRTGGDGYPAPGNPENYPVVLNDKIVWSPGTASVLPKVNVSQEDGKTVKGRGRIYFRIGTTGTTSSNRYATILVSYVATPETGSAYRHSSTIYVRQGEIADYVFENSSTIPAYEGQTSGEWMMAGQNRKSTVRFSPYNLTAPAYKTGSIQTAIPLDRNGGVAVSYPSQGGAYFQWTDTGLNPAADIGNHSPYRYAYTPNLSLPIDAPHGWPAGYTSEFRATEEYKGKYWDNHFGVSETCPPGWRRPNDGFTDRPAINTLYFHYDPNGISAQGNYVSQAENSEVRMSLMYWPDAGDSHGLGIREEDGEPVEPDEANRVYPSYPYRNGLEFTQAGTLTLYPALSLTQKTGDGDRPGLTRPYNEGGGFLSGFYADGFFDRHPKKVPGGRTGNLVWIAKENSADAAYRGALLFDPETKRSLFVPYAGRRRNAGTASSSFDGIGSTSYLWTASTGPYLTWKYTIPTWGVALNYYFTQFNSVQYYFAHNIRCVTDTEQIMPE